MTRVFPDPAPARMSSGPLTVSTASRCWGLSLSRKEDIYFDCSVLRKGQSSKDKVEGKQLLLCPLSFLLLSFLLLLEVLPLRFPHRRALRARTDIAQVVPRVDA